MFYLFFFKHLQKHGNELEKIETPEVFTVEFQFSLDHGGNVFGI